MIKKKKKTLCFSLFLALSMFLGQLIPVTAEDNTLPAEEQTTETAEPTPEPEVTEDVPDPVPDTVPTEDGEGNGEADPTVPEEEPAETEGEQPAPEEEEGTVDYQEKVDGIQVSVTADKGAFPENAALKVSKLDPGSSEYKKAEKTLDSQNYEYSGFMAMDIHFEVDDQEVEPAEGKQVQVNLSVDKTKLPEETEALNTLEVQHHEEVDATVTAKPVAAAADSTVNVEGQTVTADFTVESFSTFTITWTDGNYTTYAQLPVILVDENGNELSKYKSNISFSDASKKYGMSSIAPTVAMHKYTGAYIKVNDEKKSFQTITFSQRRNDIKITFDTTPQITRTYSNSPINDAIYLEYKTLQNGESATVQFDTNGGSGSAPERVTGTIGQTIKLPEYTGTKVEYKFVGWAAVKETASIEGGELVYKPGDDYTISLENVTLYAVWNFQGKENATFYIRTDGTIPEEPGQYPSSNYTSGIRIENTVTNKYWTWDTTALGQPPANQNYLDNKVTAQLLVLPTTEQIKHVYKNFDPETQYIYWYVQKYADGTYPNGNWHVDGALMDRAKLTVTYNRNCDDTEVSVPLGYQVDKGTPITVGVSGKANGAICPVSRNGYQFLGWNTKADGTGASYQNANTYNVTEDVTFYAQWARDTVPFTLSHTVSGNMANKEELFDFKLVLKDENDEIITTAQGDLKYDPAQNAHVISLKHGGSVKVNLPLGTKVKVTQVDNKGYTTTHGPSINDHEISGLEYEELTMDTAKTVHFNNHKQADVPSGLSDHDNYLSAFMLAAGSSIILLAMIIGVRRRMSVR